MQVDVLRPFFDASPAVRLLKSDHAPYVIAFLYQTFKLDGVLSFEHSELRSRLSVYLDSLHDELPELMTGPPDRYLVAWSDAGWLSRRLRSSSSEPQYQLTRHAEATLQFVDSALSRGNETLGTESRLRLVIETLHDLVRGASDDPDRRLQHLLDKKAEIERDIEILQSGGHVDVYQPSQIRERLRVAIDLLKTLQGDFRAVEERFEEIARDVQQNQQHEDHRRGEILKHALDAEDLLKEEDEGISFYAFVGLLFSPSEMSALRETIAEAITLPAVEDQRDATDHLRRMVPSLLAEADKVMRTNTHLSATLRRLLDGNSIEHRQRVAEELQEIRQLALQLRDDPPVETIGLDIDTQIGVNSPFSRSFWSPPQVFDDDHPTEYVVDLSRTQAASFRLAQMQRLDFVAMRTAIQDLTELGETVTLVDIIARRPPRSGVVELVGYLQIAHDDGHTIDRDTIDELTIDDVDTGTPLCVRVPRVTFRFKKEQPRRRPR